MRVRLRHDRLAEALAKRPLTLNRWAQILGVSSGHLSELTTGRRRYPTGATREKLLRGLGREFDDLFEVEQPQQPEPPSVSGEPPPASVSPVPVSPVPSAHQPVPCWDRGAAVARPRTAPSRSRPASSASSGGADMNVFSTFVSELRHAVRFLARRPGFALAAVLTLAIGIGANFALFSLVNAALLRPYPYHQPDRIVDVRGLRPAEGGGSFVSNWSWLDYLDLSERARGVIELAAWDWEPFSLAGGDRPARVAGGQVTASFFDVMGVRPLLGRTFTEEERAGDERLVVLGEAVWRNHFGADPAIVGRAVTLDGAPATVLGVMPAYFDHPDLSAIWVPLRASTAPETRGSNWARIYGRPAPGVDIAAAEERLRAIAAELAKEHPDFDEGLSAFAQSLREDEIGDVRPLFWVLLAVVVVVLLIVCANVANLLLSRSTERREEMALRAALGAGRRRLLSQLLVEGAVLAALGVGAGVPLGFLALRGARRLIPVELPAWFDLSPDGRVAAYTAAVAVTALVLSSLVPALRASRGLQAAGSRRGVSGTVQAGRLRAALVVAQVALSVVLLVGALLMVKSFATLGRVDPGFDARGKLVLGIDLLALRSLPAEERTPRFLRVREALAAVPGVAAVGAIDRIPLGSGTDFRAVLARDSELGEDGAVAVVSRVTPGYFDAIGLVVQEGSDFAWPPDESAAREIAISRQLADQAWPEESAIGREVALGSRPGVEPEWRRVRAVVSDVRHLGLDRESYPGVYLADGSTAMTRSTWVVRGEQAADGGEIDPDALADAARAAVATVDPSQPLHDVLPLEEFVARSLWNERFFATVFSVFTVVAVLLAAIGLYGLLAYVVALRRREVGLRMALGADRGAVARLVAGQGVRLVAVGLLLGLPAAVLAGRALAGLLYGVRPIDPTALLLCPALLVAVAAVAIVLPARRAASLDPAVTLRGE
jgi:predicted permease